MADSAIETACAAIMGERLMRSITDDMGIHWAVVAAMADERAADNPEAVETIKQWIAEKKSALPAQQDQEQ